MDVNINRATGIVDTFRNLLLFLMFFPLKMMQIAGNWVVSIDCMAKSNFSNDKDAMENIRLKSTQMDYHSRQAKWIIRLLEEK